MNLRAFKQTAGLMILLFVLHFILASLNLYWIFLWLDNVIHALAGVVIAMFIISLQNTYKLVSWSWGGFLRRLSLVLVVAIAAVVWEFVERALHISKAFNISMDDARKLLCLCLCTLAV
jgi:hypothetical protein